MKPNIAGWPHPSRAKKPPKRVVCPKCFKALAPKGSKTHIAACKGQA